MGVFSGALAQAIPVIGWAYAIYSIIDAIFGGDDIPDPWGTGSFVWNGNGVTYQTAGETGGNEAVQNVMGSVVSTLNSLIEQSSQQNTGGQLGIIPNRMPTVGYDTSGYRFTDIDPLSGAEKHPALRFDTSGKPYNATPGSPESFQSIVEGMVYSALGRGAIAPMWEVLTAKAQTDAGDPKAGLTEEERAARDGKLAAPVTGPTQTFRPVVLDIDGDGIETVGKNVSGVAFDVDDSGFLKQTGWVAGGDGFLTLDRDYNGQTNSGKEMFSNSKVDLSRRGLAGMEWVDSNFDGKLTSLDPVWNELRVWLDDGDGVDEAGEKLALSALGITELNYSMGTFTQNGQVKQLASPNLDADKEGTLINVVPEGSRSKVAETRAALMEAQRQQATLAAETRRQLLDQLNLASQKAASLEQELIKAERRSRLMRLTAPVTGTVQQLAVTTIGGVVTPAQPLMVVVPKDNVLEVEAMLPNKDIGFVNPGQDAEVKVETFPFTKYGTLHGKVTQVSSDAIQDEKLGLIYSTRVKLTRDTLQVENKTVRLTPGMAVTVEVKTGTRRVIEYFLSPLLQTTSESLRER